MSTDNVRLSANDVLMEQILTSKSFKRVAKNDLRTMVQRIEILRVHAGETIFRQGEVGDCFYIIRDGTCRVLTSGADGKMVEAATLGPGDTFGEDSLIVGTPRGASIEMQTDGTLARLNKGDFETLIKNPLLRGVDVEEATALFVGGACLIDARSASAYERYAIPGSRNVPLSELRRERRGFERQHLYIAVSDRELEGALAAFLLAQKGLDARYLTAPVADLMHACVGDELNDLGLPGSGNRDNVIELPEEYLRAGREQLTPVRVSDRPSKPVAAVPVRKSESGGDAVANLRGEFQHALQEQETRHREEMHGLRVKLRQLLSQYQDRITAIESRMQSLEGGRKDS